MRIRTSLLVVLGSMLSTAPAFAQGTYVSASVVGDLSRFSSTTINGIPADSYSGSETIGFALRGGVPLGAAWGIEAEFSMSGEVDNGLSPGLAALSSPRLGYVPDLSLPFGIDIRQTEQRSAFSSIVWARQQLTSRSALVYLGGASFARTSSTIDIAYNFIALPPIPGFPLPTPILPPPTQRIEGVVHTVRPVVGVEGRIALTDHLELVPGIRLTGLDNGVLIRPAVGLGWSF